MLAIFQGGIFPGENVKAIKSENTIGRFYNHILNALGYLTNCGKDSSIFTGNPSKQVNFDGWSVQGKTIKVTDYQSSIAAIQAIVEQGEGSSPCNPDSWFSRKQQLSHYYLFYITICSTPLLRNGRLKCFTQTVLEAARYVFDYVHFSVMEQLKQMA